MELVTEDKNKKVYVDGNKTYTMLNMGNYIGYKQRQWYEQSQDIWMLMSYDENNVHIESLIDDLGGYIRFIVSSNGISRVVQLNNGSVYNDSLVWNVTTDGIAKESYVALDGDIYSNNKFRIDEYLSQKQAFIKDGQPYDDVVTDNTLLINYIQKNIELGELISSQSRKN